MRWMTLLNRFCWARLLISSRRMLASNQRNKPLLKKKNHECIGRKSIAGADSDGRGADWPRRAQLRYLLATAQGPDRFHRNADGRPHRQSRHCAVALPANGRFEEGHQHLYQFTGGSVTAGLAVYDTMQFLTCDVTTYCLGMAASMAAVLLCAGTKGKRFALPNSDIMIHQ